MSRALLVLLCCAFAVGCAAAPAPPPLRPLVAHLGAEGGDGDGMAAIAAAFAAANPGYAVAFAGGCRQLDAAPQARVLFVQRGEAVAVVARGPLPDSSSVGVGDLVLLPPGARLRLSQPCDLLVFALPSTPEGLPLFVRPDWDPRIADTPGGCADDAAAYRRLLLTWDPQRGPYCCQLLNAHRVRIDDSFTHYHPQQGGFDEFYLVQQAPAAARLLTSGQREAIERPQTVAAAQAKGLLQATPLQVGDLCYLPRGLVHRGLGGAVVQVIAVPGFVPGAEIGVDHHLRAIDERLQPGGAVPYHRAAAAGR